MKNQIKATTITLPLYFLAYFMLQNTYLYYVCYTIRYPDNKVELMFKRIAVYIYFD